MIATIDSIVAGDRVALAKIDAYQRRRRYRILDGPERG
jgi:hypothetical protein